MGRPMAWMMIPHITSNIIATMPPCTALLPPTW